MKTGPKPHKVSFLSFLDKEYTFNEMCTLSKRDVFSRGKIEYKCVECGKIESIAPNRFARYKGVFCRTCNLKKTIDYQDMLKRRQTSNEKTCLEKYGVKNVWQTPENSKKRNEATHTKESIEKKKKTFSEKTQEEWEEIKQKAIETSIKKYGSYEEMLRQKQEKYEKTCMERYGVKNYRALCRPIRYKFDGFSFDSSWELAFYLYHKKRGSEILREPVKLEFDFCGETRGCFPDFSVDGILYEIKGDMFFDEDGNLINVFDRTQDSLYKAKQECMIKNGVIFLKGEELKGILEEFEENKKLYNIEIS